MIWSILALMNVQLHEKEKKHKHYTLFIEIFQIKGSCNLIG